MKSNGPDDTLCMQGICILRMFKGTFSLEAPHVNTYLEHWIGLCFGVREGYLETDILKILHSSR